MKPASIFLLIAFSMNHSLQSAEILIKPGETLRVEANQDSTIRCGSGPNPAPVGGSSGIEVYQDDACRNYFMGQVTPGMSREQCDYLLNLSGRSKIYAIRQEGKCIDINDVGISQFCEKICR